MLLAMKIFLIIVGIEHLGIAFLELAGKPEQQAPVFGMPLGFVKLPNARIALGNMGIYNFMLAVSLLVSAFLFSGTVLLEVGFLLSLFVLVVGIYGGATVTRSIYLVQGLPGVIGIVFWLIGIM